MDLELVYTYDEGCALALSEDEVYAACQLVLEKHNIERICSISISVVSDDHIAELNNTWRTCSGPTDVLSFECEHPNDVDLAEDDICELGDIVLAPHYIAQQARDMHTSAHDETLLMVVHGCLHLLGYDHLDDEEADTMQGIEDSILEELPSDNTLTRVVLARHREEQT